MITKPQATMPLLKSRSPWSSESTVSCPGVRLERDEGAPNLLLQVITFFLSQDGAETNACFNTLFDMHLFGKVASPIDAFH